MLKNLQVAAFNLQSIAFSFLAVPKYNLENICQYNVTARGPSV